jgi:hypothetical protein
MPTGLEIGFLLDRRWYWLRGEMEHSKKPALLLLGAILSDAGIPYAIIGGVALQLHQAEPRTTLDIDVALSDLRFLPRDALKAAGFAERGRYAHSENWLGPEGVPVQFTDDPALGGAVRRAEPFDLEGVSLRIIARIDLLHEKLRAGGDPALRRSKRFQDLADAQALLEGDPSLAGELTDAKGALLDRLP